MRMKLIMKLIKIQKIIMKIIQIKMNAKIEKWKKKIIKYLIKIVMYQKMEMKKMI